MVGVNIRVRIVEIYIKTYPKYIYYMVDLSNYQNV